MTSQAEIRRQITNQIVAHLEQGVRPWVKPWSADPNCGFPTNIVSQKMYSGINPLILGSASLTHNFSSRWWGTYRQWQSLGGQVRRRPDGVPPGRWGTQIIFYQPVERQVTNKQGEEKTERFPIMRTFAVFNADQVEGVRADRLQPTEPIATAEPQERHEAAESALAACNADVRHGGDRAFYRRPSENGGDYIQMPNAERFATSADYFTTLAHEHVHWSEVRMGWTGNYAMGELVAELGSCYLAAELGIPLGEHVENHSAYLESWVRELKDDDRALFKAAAQASKAADYLLSFSRTPVSSDKAEETVGELANA